MNNFLKDFCTIVSYGLNHHILLCLKFCPNLMDSLFQICRLSNRLKDFYHGDFTESFPKALSLKNSDPKFPNHLSSFQEDRHNQHYQKELWVIFSLSICVNWNTLLHFMLKFYPGYTVAASFKGNLYWFLLHFGSPALIVTLFCSFMLSVQQVIEMTFQKFRAKLVTVLKFPCCADSLSLESKLLIGWQIRKRDDKE